MSKSKAHIVSLIIPAFKQEKTIQKDIQRIKSVLDQLRYDYEIIVVVDGFIDKTFQNANRIRSQKLIVTGYRHNHGKGHAIRFGMARAKGDILAFMDAGMDINPNGISMLLEHFEWYDADIIVGSKRHPVSKVIDYPLHRKIISVLSQVYIKIVFGLTIRDTQVGMKFFKRKVLEQVMPRLLVKQYAFDIELLVVSKYLGFKRIFEAPIEINWTLGAGITSNNLVRTIFLTFVDTLAIFYRLHILRYYSSANKRRWKYDPELNFRVNLP